MIKSCLKSEVRIGMQRTCSVLRELWSGAGVSEVFDEGDVPCSDSVALVTVTRWFDCLPS